MTHRYELALDMAAFLRRTAHSRLRMERLLFPEWRDADTRKKREARSDLRQAIGWIQVAKFERDRHAHD